MAISHRSLPSASCWHWSQLWFGHLCSRGHCWSRNGAFPPLFLDLQVREGGEFLGSSLLYDSGVFSPLGLTFCFLFGTQSPHSLHHAHELMKQCHKLASPGVSKDIYENNLTAFFFHLSPLVSGALGPRLSESCFSESCCSSGSRAGQPRCVRYEGAVLHPAWWEFSISFLDPWVPVTVRQCPSCQPGLRQMHGLFFQSKSLCNWAHLHQPGHQKGGTLCG